MVRARGQTREVVDAAVGRHRLRHQRIGHAVVQTHRHAIDARLAVILRAVGVLVLEHLVADAHRHVHASVQRVVVFTRSQRDDLRLARAVGVAVAGVRALVLGSEHRARRLGRELDLVLLAHVQAVEAVLAVDTGGGRGGGVVATRADHAIGAAADQRHRLAADARFARVLLAVTVGVRPQPVAQAGSGWRWRDQARVDGLVGLARSQVHQLGEASGIGIAVIQVGRAAGVGVRNGEVVGRSDELDLVLARLQASKLVVALFDGHGAEVVARQGAGDLHAIGVVQLDHDAIDALLIAVLDAVGIAVEPNVVAKLGALQLDDQRLDRPAGINHRGEESVGRQETATRGRGSLRHRHQAIRLRRADDVAVVVIQEPVIACRGDLRVAVPQNLPDRDLDFAEVVLTGVLGIRREVLRQQPVDLVDPSLRDGTDASRSERRGAIARVVACRVGRRRQKDVGERVQAIRVIDTIRD